MINLILMRNTRLATWGIFFLLITNNVSGQKDYKNGYIITNNIDTIYGLINLRSNYHNRKVCEFKKNTDTISELFSPRDIRAYMIDNGKFYISKNITVNDTVRKVFLEFLLDGIVDLYYYKEFDDEFYFIEKDSTMYQLSNEATEVFIDDVRYIQNSNRYIGVLSYLFQESPGLSGKINNTVFEYKSLVKITKDYHDNVCNDYKCIDYTKSTKTNIYLEPNIGLINSWMGLKSSSDLSYDIKPVIGINFRIIPVKIHYLWNFLVGINYSTNYFKHDFKNKLFDKGNKTFRIEMKYSIIRLPIMLEYSFPTKKLQPFLSVGYNNVFILNPDYDVRQVYSYFGTEYTGGTIDTDFRNYQYGFLSGLGVRYKINDGSRIYLKVDSEYRAPPANFRHILDYHHVKTLIFNLGYSFSLK